VVPDLGAIEAPSLSPVVRATHPDCHVNLGSRGNPRVRRSKGAPRFFSLRWAPPSQPWVSILHNCKGTPPSAAVDSDPRGAWRIKGEIPLHQTRSPGDQGAIPLRQAKPFRGRARLRTCGEATSVEDNQTLSQHGGEPLSASCRANPPGCARSAGRRKMTPRGLHRLREALASPSGPRGIGIGSALQKRPCPGAKSSGDAGCPPVPRL
jgi:hypothetical protein